MRQRTANGIGDLAADQENGIGRVASLETIRVIHQPRGGLAFQTKYAAIGMIRIGFESHDLPSATVAMVAPCAVHSAQKPRTLVDSPVDFMTRAYRYHAALSNRAALSPIDNRDRARTFLPLDEAESSAVRRRCHGTFGPMVTGRVLASRFDLCALPALRKSR